MAPRPLKAFRPAIERLMTVLYAHTGRGPSRNRTGLPHFLKNASTRRKIHTAATVHARLYEIPTAIAPTLRARLQSLRGAALGSAATGSFALSLNPTCALNTYKVCWFRALPEQSLAYTRIAFRFFTLRVERLQEGSDFDPGDSS